MGTAEPLDGREVGLMPLPVSMDDQTVFLPSSAPQGPAPEESRHVGEQEAN